MKTKLVISSYDDINNPHFGGGGAIAIHEVARRLSVNFKLKVITSKYNNSRNEETGGVTYKRIGLDVRMWPQLSQFIYSLCLPYYLLFEDYDIWIESFTPPFSTGFLQLFTKRPVVGLVHMLSGEDMKRKYKLPFDLIEKMGLKTYKYFIVNSDSIKNKILKENKEAKIDVIGNGIEKTTGNSGKAKYALFMGRIEINQKGLDLLIKSWEDINKKLVIAGSGIEFSKLKRLVADNKLQEKIILVGNVSGHEKEKLFKDAAFVVVPSRFETFSMVALEAFSYGLPVVSFDIEGLEWAPKGAVLKIPTFNTKSFATGCKVLFNDASKRKQMGAIGKSYAKKYTWETVSNRYNNFILKIK